MTDRVRAKFTCMTAEPTSKTATTYRFSAVHDDGDANREWSRATPWGECMIFVTNPDVSFVAGKAYWLDFSPVQE